MQLHTICKPCLAAALVSLAVFVASGQGSAAQDAIAPPPNALPPNPPAPNAPAAPPAAPPNPNTVNLVENLERLKLDFEKILALHGPGVATKADLYEAIGKAASE